MLKVARGSRIRIEFELKVKGGEVIETSAQSGPIEYAQGEGKLLPALEARIEGMTIGEEKRGEIPSAEAFPEASLPTKDIPRKEFPAGMDVAVDTVFEAKGPTGAPVSFKVIKADAELVTVRFLHPLAGKALEFRVKVIMIDDPQAKKRAVSIPPPPVDALAISPDDIEIEK